MRKLKKLAPTSNLRLQSFRGTLQRLSVALLTLVMTLTAQTAWADVVEVSQASDFGIIAGGSFRLESKTYKLKSDIVLNDAYLQILSDVTATLDLNGYGICSNFSPLNSTAIRVSGNLTIIDSNPSRLYYAG